MAKDSFKVCYGCGLEATKCYCDQLPLLENKDRVVILTTRRESFIRSNSGRLIHKVLKNNTRIFMGEEGWEEALQKEINDDKYFPILFYPYPSAKGSKTLKLEVSKPLNIILLDTNWKGARKWIYKDCLSSIQKAELKGKYVSEYKLRDSPAENYLCTLQALSAFYSEMETEDNEFLSKQLMEVLNIIVDKMLIERGIKIEEKPGQRPGRYD